MPLTALRSSDLDAEGRGYPRPQLRRASWYSLNGDWDFALDPLGAWKSVQEISWMDRIRVPFAPEAPASGIAQTGFFRVCWYRKRCELPPRDLAERWLLHFGAVDWKAGV